MHKKIATSLVFVAMMLFGSVAMAAELVNLNKANAAAIQQNLVGIGPIKAEAIISYRKKNGKFGSIEDLQNVTGIGPALIKKNKRYLSLSKGAVSGDDKAYAASKKQAKNKSGTRKKTSKTNTSTTAKPAKKSAKDKTKTTAKPAKKSTDKGKSKNKPATAKPAKKSTVKKSTDKKSTDKKKPAKKKATTKQPAKKKPAKKKKSKTSKSTT